MGRKPKNNKEKPMTSAERSKIYRQNWSVMSGRSHPFPGMNQYCMGANVSVSLKINYPSPEIPENK